MTATTAFGSEVTDLEDLAEVALLSEATEIESVLREGEVHKLRIAYQWAIAHPPVDAWETRRRPRPPCGAHRAGDAGRRRYAGGGGVHQRAARRRDGLLARVRLVAPRRHPRPAPPPPLLWDQARALLVPAWKARRVASRTRGLSFDAARWVDRQVAGRVSSLSAPALDRLVAEAAARCDGDDLAEREQASRSSWDVVLAHPDPHRYSGTSELHATGDTLDLTRFHDVVCAEAEALGALGDADPLGVRKAKALGVIADAQARLDLTSLVGTPDPEAHEQARREALGRRDAKVRLYLHASLADVVAGTPGATGSVEALGPATLDLIREWAGRSRVTIQPVLHVAADDRWSVDRHDPPPRMAEQVRLRDETCVFPWCGRSARQCDLDHRDPFLDPGDGGPPGQTSPDSLAPLCRRHHRAKTAGRWTYERTGPGSLPLDRAGRTRRPGHSARHRQHPALLGSKSSSRDPSAVAGGAARACGRSAQPARRPG